MPRAFLVNAAEKDVSSLANRTNHSRRISSDKRIRGNVPGDDRTGRNDRILTHGDATDNGRSGRDPYVFLNHDALSDYGGATLGWCDRVDRRNDTHVRPDHHVIANADLGKVIQSAVLIDEDAMPDADRETIGRVERRNES